MHSLTVLVNKRLPFSLLVITKDGLHFNDSDISISGVSFRLKSQNVFVYTDGDVINFDVSPVFTVAIGGPTIEPFT